MSVTEKNDPGRVPFGQVAKSFLVGFCVGFAALALALFLWVTSTPICSRIQPNEATAITALKNYHTAQITFSVGNQAAIAGNTSAVLGPNAYADNYRNLFYGVEKKGNNLSLVSKAMADAFLVDNALGGAKTRDGAQSQATPYSGYYFMEDIFNLTASQYDKEFACLAFPAVYGETGYHVFWVGMEGVVYRHDPKAESGTPASDLYRRYSAPTPISPHTAIKWKPY